MLLSPRRTRRRREENSKTEDINRVRRQAQVSPPNWLRRSHRSAPLEYQTQAAYLRLRETDVVQPKHHRDLPPRNCRTRGSFSYGTSHAQADRRRHSQPRVTPARESGREVDIRSMKRHSRNRHSSPWCIRISLWIGATVTFSVSPTSLLPATAGRGDDHRAGALCREHPSAGSSRVCDSRLARADGSVLGIHRDKTNEFEVMELSDEFLRTGFPTMSHTFARLPRTTDESQATDLKARTR